MNLLDDFVHRSIRDDLLNGFQFSSLVCTTTPCPTTGWPLVTWKGSGTHVPLSSKLLAPTHGYSPTELPTCLQAWLADHEVKICKIKSMLSIMYPRSIPTFHATRLFF
ncbi:unnamed protein product [Spirodela intermedia]|uniref:Uncharacterized protein n=1 Tax=Spirodela intermedia TaxID=51605 RepID=A0ABN7EAH9_SPIIN|nr:unnamed protein product [Spirodela intermedia]